MILSCIQLCPSAYLPSATDGTKGSAPWFTIPPKFMPKIERKMAKVAPIMPKVEKEMGKTPICSPISDTPTWDFSKAPVPDAHKEAVDQKASTDEFLNVLHAAMPAAGTGHLGPTTFKNGYQMGLTENAAATYLSSGSRCLDFFFQVVPTTPQEEVERLITLAWQEDPLKALKLIFHLRGVRGTGKSDKERFYQAALWLHEEHPDTLLANVASIAEFGYFKDLLEVILRLVLGPARLRKKIEQKEQYEIEKEWSIYGVSIYTSPLLRRTPLANPSGSAAMSKEGRTAAAALKKKRRASEEASARRVQDREEKALMVYEKFHQDPRFQALYMEVAKVFAEQLQADSKALQEDRLRNISLAAKWAPSLNLSHDKQTMMCYAIARQMFPKEDFAEYADLSDTVYACVVRLRLQNEVLRPLRKVLEIPEIYMSAQRWGDVNYQRVPSVAMRNYSEIFMHHDEERFMQYLEDVEAGKAKVAAGALYPHQIVEAAMNDYSTEAKVADLQWLRMVDDLKKLGTLTNCIAVCDVSGSMTGEPMNVCIALGILLSDLSEEPWKGNVITFSETPQIHKVKGDTLKQKARFVQSMNWDMNTNLQLVFDRILEMAKAENLAPEKMIKRLFVFSDMEFDACSNSRNWETDYDAIVRKFKDSGFGKPPEIVFWNLGHTSSIPVIKSELGVGLVAGFSKNLLKIFLENDGEINPMLIMDAAIAGKEYDALRLVD